MAAADQRRQQYGHCKYRGTSGRDLPAGGHGRGGKDGDQVCKRIDLPGLIIIFPQSDFFVLESFKHLTFISNLCITDYSYPVEFIAAITAASLN